MIGIDQRRIYTSYPHENRGGLLPRVRQLNGEPGRRADQQQHARDPQPSTTAARAFSVLGRREQSFRLIELRIGSNIATQTGTRLDGSRPKSCCTDGVQDMDYDLITIGGGLAGSTLAKAMAEKGYRILVLERETTFRDRVRGEFIQSWGTAEARELGIYDLLKQTCGTEIELFGNTTVGLPKALARNLVATTPNHLGSLCYYHPEMQQVVLDAAVRAGADVHRGVTPVEVLNEHTPTVRIRRDGSERTYRARLIAAADGRRSVYRNWADMQTRRDLDRMVLAGVLLEGLAAPTDSAGVYRNPPGSEVAMIIPLKGGRHRCYYGFYQQPGRQRLSGRDAVHAFVEHSVGAGMPRDWFASPGVAGPLASFDAYETWVEHPYRNGVALVGDAAASSDPCFGCGQALTLRDVRVLRDALLQERDWDKAAHAYAAEHDRYFASLHRLIDWMTQLLFEPGPVAGARRERAFARIIENPRRVPDLAGMGPEAASDSAAYHELFGDDAIQLPTRGTVVSQWPKSEAF